MEPRILTIGDIHGCGAALRELLKTVQPRAEDLVIVLGDVIDRGPAVPDVIEQLLELEQHCRTVLIRGNHEEQLFRSLESAAALAAWVQHGGDATLAAYGGSIEQIPARHLDLLARSVDWYTLGHSVFVHAGLESGVPLSGQSAPWLRWVKFDKSRPPWLPGWTVYCGHTPQKSGLPLALPGWRLLDTWAYGSLAGGNGWLTCLDVATARYWQSREGGGQRDGVLQEFEAEQVGTDRLPTPL